MHKTNLISQYFGKFASKEFPRPIQKLINASYVKLMKLDLKEFKSSKHYKSLNALFTRELEITREIDNSENIFISPSDSLITEAGKLNKDIALQIKGMEYSVEELLTEAEKLHLSLLSITDHDTIQAHFKLQNPAIRNLFSGAILPGVELTTTYKGETIEVLGYGFDLDKMQQFLNENVLTFEEKQNKEYELIKKQYKKIGVHFNEENISFNPKIESCRPAFAMEIKKYPENYKFFLNQESIHKNSGFTRQELFNPKSPLYVDESSLFPSIDTVLQMIHTSGGLAFLAHTFAYSPNIASELSNILNQYLFDGLECFYTTFTEEQSTYLVHICKERNLYRSGGSDFHGTRKINHNLGTGNGQMYIEESVVEDWIEKYLPRTRKRVLK